MGIRGFILFCFGNNDPYTIVTAETIKRDTDSVAKVLTISISIKQMV